MATRVPSRCIIAPSGEMAASPGSRARCSWTCASSRSCRHRIWALRSRPTSKSRSTSRWAAYEAGKRRACGDGALLDRCGRLPLDDPPWYTQCAACHIDPSGGTLLTKYGRAQSELLLSSRWGAGKEDEPSPRDDFLLGALRTPDSLTLGGWFRYGYIWNTVDGTLVDDRLLQMRGDVAAALRIGPVRAA